MFYQPNIGIYYNIYIAACKVGLGFLLSVSGQSELLHIVPVSP